MPLPPGGLAVVPVVVVDNASFSSPNFIIGAFRFRVDISAWCALISLSLRAQACPILQETQMTIQKKLHQILLALFVAVAPVVAIAFNSAPAAAQIVGGSINGTIHDSTGAAVPGATVSVRQTD